MGQFFRSCVTATSVASHEVELLYRVLYVSPYRAYWVISNSATVLLFPDDSCGFPSDTGPRSLAIPGSSSRELCLLSRVYYCLTPARRPQPTSSFLGVFALLSDINPRNPLVGGLPTTHLRSAHSVSHTPDGLLFLAPCGLISSHYHF